ncbi:MAG: peptidoglycan recognition protein family protein [Planctomycetes bacterium]|nr:peptidoglycan recognition protein family protein [Planctomycetota bacterium]
MSLSRRDFVLLGMGLMAAGCASQQQTQNETPDVLWPGHLDRPVPTGPGSATLPTHPNTGAIQPPRQQVVETPVAGSIQAIPRSRWAAAGPIMSKMIPMNGINRITVHHEGWTPVYFTDAATTASRLERVRQGHLSRLSAGDIGYHFVIDRAGRVWQGRDLRYQGAHVKANNEHNIGVMCLGNFDQQSPSDPQLVALRDTVSKLMRQYHVSSNRNIKMSRVQTHQEINPTRCPGLALQPKMVWLRQNGYLG